MDSPKPGRGIRVSTQDHVDIRASLQVARNRRDICEAFKDTGWWARAIIEYTLGNQLVPCNADVRRKDCSLRVLDIGREICNSGTDLFEHESGIGDLSALKRQLMSSLRTGDGVNCPYPYFGLRECGHREICHNPLRHSRLDRMAVRLEKVTHEVVESSLQAKEEVRVSRLGHVSDRAVGQNQVEAYNGVDRETVLIGLVRVPYW